MNYFIVVRKDNPYSRENFEKVELWLKQSDTKDEPRKHGEVYSQIQEGDLLLCYSGEDRRICAVLEARDKIDLGINLKFKDELDLPLELIKDERIYKDILALSPPLYSPFTKDKSNIFYGTFFATTKEQFFYLCGLYSQNKLKG